MLHIGISDLKPPDASGGVAGENIVSELGSKLDGILQVKDMNFVDGDLLSGDKDAHSDLEDENVVSDGDPVGATTVKRLDKSVTFPCAGCTSLGSRNAVNKTPVSELPDNSSYCRSVSLPTPRKLVSALKGSREKEGLPLKKLSVKWAHDVYDPLPTAVSHLPKKKSQQQSRNKKHGKGKQKGKNVRSGGSAPKEKKHYRKMVGRSEHRLDSSLDSGRLVSGNYKSPIELLDFGDDNDNSADSNCGTSFLRKAGGTVHIPYAEAT